VKRDPAVVRIEGEISVHEKITKNTTIHISSPAHLNITFNLFQCGNNELIKDGVLSLKTSNTFILLYVNEGSGLLEINNLAFKISKGQGMVAFPDGEYDLRNMGEEPLDLVWLSFTGYLVENYLNRANIYRSKPIIKDKEGVVGETLNAIYKKSLEFPNRYCPMMSMLYHIFEHLLDANPTKRSGEYVDSADFFASKAVSFIENNYSMNISVDDIANFLGISRKHLYSIFNTVLKISPKQYLIYYRIEKACMRLKSTNQSVLEIAESVGYLNQFYFSKEFKRLTNMTPTEYRKNSDLCQIFSYRSFVPTLEDGFVGTSLEVPFKENIISVSLPPQPARKDKR